MQHVLDLGGRIALSLMFFVSGIDKIGGYDATQAYMASQGVPGALLPAVILLEILAPMIVVGWHTRLAALALAGFSLLAAILFHADFGNQMQMILFMKNVSIAGGLVVLTARGPGALSLDHRARR